MYSGCDGDAVLSITGKESQDYMNEGYQMLHETQYSNGDQIGQ